MRAALPFALLLAACTSHAHPVVAPMSAKLGDPALVARADAIVAPAHDELAARDPRVTDLDVIRIRATSTGAFGDPELDAVATVELFKRANAAAKDQRRDEAIRLYRQIVAEFPESQFASLSLFNIAAIYDGRGDPTATVATLRELIAHYPDSRESIDGHLYIAAIQSEHKQYADAVETLDAVLTRDHLTFADKIEAGARRGYALLELGKIDDCAASLAAAVAEYQRAPRIEDSYYIAMALYYQGELAHRKFAVAPVRAPDDQIIADLDAKRSLAVAAYDLWQKALEMKQPYWASAAGYQMSEIYAEMWQATVRAPWPDRVAVARRGHYATELHTRMHDYLVKALDGHRMNVELAKAYGVDTAWSRGSDQRAGEIMQLLAKEDSGDFVMPTPGS